MIILYVILLIFTIIAASCGVILFIFWIKASNIIKKKPIIEAFKEASMSDAFISVKEVSPVFIRTLLYSEDALFPFHNGYISKQILYALMQNIKKRRIVYGGSTITQQLAKNVFLHSRKTFARKIMEFFISCKIEKTLTKENILSWYLTILNFENGLIGLKSIVSHYFLTSLNNINLFDSIALVAALPNPKLNLPGRQNDERAFYYCLKRMNYNNYFEEEDYGIAQDKQSLIKHPELNDKYCKIASNYVNKYLLK